MLVHEVVQKNSTMWNSQTGTPRQIHVNSTWILRRYIEDQISTIFLVISSYFFDVISMVEKSTLLPRTSIEVISLVQKSTLLPYTFFNVICLVEICTFFLLTFLDVILMGKNPILFLVSCQLMKILEEVFLVFVTLNSWLVQDCSI